MLQESFIWHSQGKGCDGRQLNLRRRQQSLPGTDVVVLFFQKADLLLVLLDVQRIGGIGCLFIIEEAETEEG